MKKKFLYVTNIPAPYRIDLHNMMYKEMNRNNIEYRVAFMARTEKIRNWNVDEMLSNALFPYKIYKDYKIYVYRSYKDYKIGHPKEFHFNPGIIIESIRGRWNFILIGGWDNLTTIILSFLPKHILKAIKIMRPESNINSIRIKGGIIGSLRRHILKQADMYAVPGLRTIEMLHKLVPDMNDDQLIELPNLINNKKWVEKNVADKSRINDICKKYGINIEKKIFFTASRVSPEKGILNFISHISKSIDSNTQIIIAGNGPQVRELESIISNASLKKKIKLLGYIEEERIHELYSIADVFFLPSIRDCNPLSTIEASFSSTALLLSNRIGNVPELLTEQNGYSFDPYNKLDACEKFKKLQKMSKNGLAEMGTISLTNARKNYDLNESVRKFINKVLKYER